MPVYPYDKGGVEHYYYAFEVKDNLGKRKTIKKRGFTSAKKAEKAERHARVEWDNQEYVNPSSQKFGDYIIDYLEKKRNRLGGRLAFASVAPEHQGQQLRDQQRHRRPVEHGRQPEMREEHEAREHAPDRGGGGQLHNHHGAGSARACRLKRAAPAARSRRCSSSTGR